MASIIKVDTIQHSDGSAPTMAELGLNVQGSVLQVVQEIKTDTQVYASNQAWVDVAGLSVNITPKALGSSFYVTAFITLGVQYFSHNFRLVRDGSVVTDAIGDAASLRTSAWTNVLPFDTGAPSAYTPYFNASISPNYLDSFSYSDLSTITYKVQGWAYTNGTINRSYEDNDDSSRTRATSTITVTEIAG